MTEDWQVLPAQAADESTANAAATIQARLRSIVDEIDSVDRRAASAILEIASQLRDDAPESSALSGQRGNEAGQASLADDIEPAELAKIGRELTLAGLTPDQLRILADGGTITDLPTGTQDYLRSFVATAGSDGIMRLHKEFAALGTPEGNAHATALADAVLAISHERVAIGDNHFGSYDELPQEMRDTISTRYGSGPDSNSDARFFSSQSFADIGSLLASSSPESLPGEQLGVELGRQAANLELLARDAAEYRPSHGGMNVGSLTKSPYDQHHYNSAIEDMMSVATRNPDVSAALLSGTTHDGAQISGYEPHNTLIPLMTREWDNTENITSMFEWIATDAQSDDPDQRARGQQGFRDLVDVTTNHETSTGTNSFHDLMHTSGGTLGQLNPALAQQLAVASVPYMNALGGMHNSLSGFDDISNISPGDSVRFMTLIAGDPEAAHMLHSHIEIQRSINAYDAVSQDYSGAMIAGETNGKLQLFFESALEADRSHRENFAHEVGQLESEKSEARRDFIRGTIGLIPHPAVGIGAEAFPLMFGDFTTPDGLVNYDTFPRAVEFNETHRGLTLSQLHAIAIAEGVPLERYPADLTVDSGEGSRLMTVQEIEPLYRERSGEVRFLSAELEQAIRDHGGGASLDPIRKGSEWAANHADGNVGNRDDYTRLSDGAWNWRKPDEN
ncbi:hypothetical protein IEU95_15885 [Hoyosella rhizosphaerae]|uniref:TPR repeat domain-containing protein n=1 Tax=Hoyosella rhizosphaerae TaxID=1755582 RepID=A0A916UI14_9ACTN|nr:hypothetical protein [Hoyosella rhizosphaerae]MBN4928316.1 hypothetical protein [Hoyosella rhizosphaerae]GGC74036.1 hypothetical protein GCM10011410_29040 [Hoyosella rhizosphaerae]